MKQTNNAIKFLMAQYRAIFKNANIAMVAAMAAAALAAGSANADQSKDGVLDASDFVNVNTGAGVKAETVTKDSALDMSKVTTVDNKAFAYAGNDADTKIDGAKVTITGAKDKHLAVKGLALTNGAELTITNTGKEANSTIYGYTSGTQAGAGDQGTLSVVGSKINATSSAFQFDKAEISGNSEITLGGQILGDKASNDKATNAEWFIYSNIGTNSGSAGTLNVTESIVNLKHESQLVSTTAVNLNGATVNFAGQTHKDGYATTFIRGIDGASEGKVTLSNGTQLNVNGDAAIYAKAIDVQSATATIAAGKKLTLDGDWTDAKQTNAGKHKTSTITVKDFTVNAEGNGKLVIGNATNASTVEITGKTVINSELVNNAEVTVSGADAVLAVDASAIENGKGIFSGSTSKLTLANGATLQLNGLTGDKSLDLADTAKVTFTDTAAQNKIKLDTAATIKGDNLVVSQKVDSGAAATIDAVNLTLGSGTFDNSANALGVKALKAEKVTFVPSGTAAFTLQNDLSLESAVANTINGAVTIGKDGGTAGNISIKGNYTADKDVIVKSGSLSIGSSKKVGLSVTDGSLTVSGGKFETTKTNGNVTLSNGKLDISKASSLAVAEGTVTMTGTSALVLDSKVIKAAGDAVDFQNGIAGNSFTGDASSKLVFSKLVSLTEAQFKDLKKDASGFKGLFEGITVTGLTVKDEMVLGGDGVQSGLTGKYDNTQATLDGTKTNIDAAYDVGNLELTSGDSVNISGGSLSLNNGNANGASGNFVQKADGTVAGVTLTGATSALTLNNEGKIGAITAAKPGEGVVNLGDVTGATKESAKVTVAGAIGSSTANVGKVALSTNASMTVTGDVYAKQFNTAAGSSVSMTDKTLVIGSGSAATDAASVILGNIEAGSIKVEGDAGVMFAGGGNIDVDTLTGSANAKIQVGDDSEGGLGAILTTTNLVLGGGSIFVDPDWHNPAGFVVTENLKTTGSAASGAGTLDGNAYVGKNAVLGIGFAKTDAGLAELKALVAPYLVDNGGFAENGVKNALVINDSITVDNDKGIAVDAGLTSDNYTKTPPTNEIKLGAGAALVVTDKALDEGAKAAVTFSNTSASGKITADQTSKVVLVGDFTAADKGKQIFAAVNSTNGSGGTVTGDVAVEAAGGLLEGKIANGSIASLDLNKYAEKAIRSEVSAPVGQLFVDFANGKFDGSTGAGYDFLTKAISNKQFKAIDAAAHAATYAGAQQAAVVSVTTMADAMFGRVGAVGVEAASIAATGSQANGGVWLTPMYKSMDADGFNAEGVSYGSDVDAAGVAFGADTVNGNMRFGAVFNIGSGDAEGKGQGNGLKDEFDYYGFGIYSAMGFGNLALVGDASMTVVSHDVQGLGLRGKADTTAVTMGLTGQYTVSTPMVDVTPHLGARFIRLNTDSYDLVGADGAIATTDFDVQNVFLVPLGVTLSKGFTTGGWTLAPSADLTITFNGGDTEAKSSTTFTGIKAINLNTEVLDEVQYGLTLGLGAQYGAFGTSFGINYTGSENTDSFGVNAQARYMF